MRNPKEPSVSQPVIVASKDASEVDNDYFLCPASIAAHTGRLLNTFPVENRLLPQGESLGHKSTGRAPSCRVRRVSWPRAGGRVCRRGEGVGGWGAGHVRTGVENNPHNPRLNANRIRRNARHLTHHSTPRRRRRPHARARPACRRPTRRQGRAPGAPAAALVQGVCVPPVRPAPAAVAVQATQPRPQRHGSAVRRSEGGQARDGGLPSHHRLHRRDVAAACAAEGAAAAASAACGSSSRRAANHSGINTAARARAWEVAAR